MLSIQTRDLLWQSLSELRIYTSESGICTVINSKNKELAMKIPVRAKDSLQSYGIAMTFYYRVRDLHCNSLS